jgi:hypothetical protein
MENDIWALLNHLLSSLFEIVPLGGLGNNGLAVVGDLNPEVVDGDLGVVAAVGLLTTCYKFFPGLFGSRSSGANAVLDFGFELLEDSLPDLCGGGLHFSDDCLTASGTFVAGLQKSAVLFLHFRERGLVDQISVLLDEGLCSVGVPFLDLSLDVVQALDHEAFRSEGLTHVAFTLGHGGLLNGVRCTDECRKD